MTFLRKLLRDGLGCDDLQRLPDTMSLLPVFQLLIRFPLLMEPRFAKVLQCLALRLLLSRSLSQETILSYVNWVNSAKTANDFLARLDSDIPGPADLRAKLPKWLEESNTLQDRYVLMLYWLLRKRGARDFSYENVNEDKQPLCGIQGGSLCGKAGQEAELEEQVRPEKQHIVPYRLLEQLYEIEKRGRASQHLVNNVGNITYISRDENDFKIGLGSTPIDLNLDPPDNLRNPPDNLKSHFLDGEIGRAYEKARDLIQSAVEGSKVMAMGHEATRETAKEAFKNFCELRRNVIKNAFVEWVEKLGPKLAIEAIEKRVRPEPTANPSLQDQIRSLDYPDDVEDSVLDLVRDKRLHFTAPRSKKEKGVVARRVKPAFDSRGRSFLIRFLENQLEVEPADGLALYDSLARLMADRGVAKKKDVWMLPVREEQGASTSAILTEFAKELTHKN